MSTACGWRREHRRRFCKSGLPTLTRGRPLSLAFSGSQNRRQTSYVFALPPSPRQFCLTAGRSNRGVTCAALARRLRDFGFSPEDAVVLAYGSFGVSADGSQVGAEAIVTADLRLAARYADNYAELEQRFRDMVTALAGVYATLRLPQVFTTTDVLTRF